MTKHTHTVIAEMVDVVTGERKFPNEGFTPHDTDQETRLTVAGCLTEGAPVTAARADADEAAAAPAPAAAKPATAPKPAAAKPAPAKPASAKP